MESVIWPLLAVGDQVWLAIIGLIGSIFAGFMTVLLAFMQHRTNVEVKQTNVEVKKTNSNVEKLGEKVEEVHVATNSLTDRLVEKTEREAFARGGVDERARADTEKMHKGEDTLKTVTAELAKLTEATDARVEGVGEQVQVVDDKVEEVRDAVTDKES